MIKPNLWIVVPCYNEEDVLPITIPLFLEQLHTMKQIHRNSKILFINDGSSDATSKILVEAQRDFEEVEYLFLSRNFGHQNALLAGMMEAKKYADIVITIDCDGQDDLSVMSDMINAYLRGAELVYGVRDDRSMDSVMKRTTALGYYRLLHFFDAEVPYNHADYRLMSKRVLDHFADFEEVNLFLRGLFPLIGFPSATVTYKRQERLAGETKYPLHKMLHLAWDGISSFSIKPIHMITSIGVFFTIFGFLSLLLSLLLFLFGLSLSNLFYLGFFLSFLEGLQISAIGLIGEYVGKSYMEAKHRPRYIIKNKSFEENL